MFNFSLCNEFKFSDIINIFKKKKDNHIKMIITDLNELLSDDNFDIQFISNHILNKIIQITESEYGFIGKVKFDNIKKEDYLQTYAITNIAWNSASSKFYNDFFKHDLKFYNLNKTLFGSAYIKQSPNIINNYKKLKRDIIPKGHPLIRRYLGIPIKIGDKTIGVIGLCNKLENFTKKDIYYVNEILKVFSIFYRMI